jgi:hypothetical protein
MTAREGRVTTVDPGYGRIHGPRRNRGGDG